MNREAVIPSATIPKEISSLYFTAQGGGATLYFKMTGAAAFANAWAFENHLIELGLQ